MLENQSWKNSFRNAFKNVQELYHFLGPEFKCPLKVAETYPIFIPLRLAQRIRADGPHGILAREFLPQLSEIDPAFNQAGSIDPIGDRTHQVAPQLIHRYYSRALFTPTSICPVHCRYCFRKNELNPMDEIFLPDFERTLNYLREHSEISEIIFTGGDPFTLDDQRLEFFLKAFAEIPTIQDIRFHTRYPVILPERMSLELIELLTQFSERFRTVSLAVHVNHALELDRESIALLRRLKSHPIQLLSQTVLLKDVNDNPETLLELFNQLLSAGVRPYYLHHPDRVKGGMHFYLPLERGRTIYAQLRTKLPGWALPHYVVDIPGGLGKTQAYNPEGFAYHGQLIDISGKVVAISEPEPFAP